MNDQVLVQAIKSAEKLIEVHKTSITLLELHIKGLKQLQK